MLSLTTPHDWQDIGVQVLPDGMSRKKTFFSGCRLYPLGILKCGCFGFFFFTPKLQIEHFHDDYLKK